MMHWNNVGMQDRPFLSWTRRSMGVYPGKSQHDKKVLVTVTKREICSYWMVGDSEKEGCSTMGYGTPSDGSSVKHLDMQEIAVWLGRQFQFHNERAVNEVASCSRVNHS